MPRRLMLLFLVALAMTSTGCLISEQIGQGNQELTFHFDTPFNWALLFGRSIALAAVGAWFFSASHGRTGPKAIGSAFLVAALVLFARGFPTITGYSVEVAKEGLHLDIPRDGEKFLEWSAIEEMYIEGFGPIGPRGDAVDQLLDLPEWYTMEITVVGGQKHLVDLKLLSLEQRQILWKAIAANAHLVAAD